MPTGQGGPYQTDPQPKDQKHLEPFILPNSKTTQVYHEPLKLLFKPFFKTVKHRLETAPDCVTERVLYGAST
jgi:hypothetical protein